MILLFSVSLTVWYSLCTLPLVYLGWGMSRRVFGATRPELASRGTSREAFLLVYLPGRLRHCLPWEACKGKASPNRGREAPLPAIFPAGVWDALPGKASWRSSPGEHTAGSTTALRIGAVYRCLVAEVSLVTLSDYTLCLSLLGTLSSDEYSEPVHRWPHCHCAVMHHTCTINLPLSSSNAANRQAHCNSLIVNWQVQF